jgi:conjugative relaxase-like TrwC/TraI family protein
MIRMIQSKSAGHAKAYFSDALVKTDYYLNDQELPGHFSGLVAHRLGIGNQASKEVFFALCENVMPGTGQPLTPRTDEERTVGYDINFHCPKSVSIVHVLSGDDHILKAVEKSVTATMKEIEADSRTRVRLNGQYEDRHTGELVWAEFTHQTARPVESLPPDPHLHSHCFVFNVTWDNEEQRFKAGQFRDIMYDLPYYKARFDKRLSDELIKLGYSIRKTDKSFEIEGVPQKVKDLFSKRTDEIGRVAKEKGITNAKELDALGARTRSKKQKGFTMDELRADWRKQIRELEKQEGIEDRTIRHEIERQAPRIQARECVDYAINHSFERASVMNDRRLLAEAYRFSIGTTSVDLDQITDSMKNDRRIIQVKEHNKTMCTTHDILMEEKRMVDLARSGRSKMKPFYTQTPKLKVQGEKAMAAAHVLTSRNRFSIITGSAGAGKTDLTTELVEHIENKGVSVTMLATTSDAARNVLREQGFEKAETVARFLVDKKMQDAVKGQVIFVDEAGVLGTKDTLSLIEIATQKNARVVFIGDTRQHASVVRGDALRILNTVGKIETANVHKIYRQKREDYNTAVTELSKGNIKCGFEKLDAMNAIKEIDPLKPNDLLTADYIAVLKQGKKALIISPTHKQGEALTDEIRKSLKEQKMLGKKEIKASRLINLNLTDAEKSDWRNYRPGFAVQFGQNVPGIKRGSFWRVSKVENATIEVINNSQEIRKLPKDRSETFSVYEQSEIPVAKGDKLRITNLTYDVNNKRMDNGMTLDVVGVRKNGKISLRNSNSKITYEIRKDHGHIAHAHCITSYASQGKTVDEVFISQPAATFPGTDAKQFYVSVSRGRDAVHIYTDDKDTLLSYASRMGDRESAIELAERGRVHDLHLAHEINRSNKMQDKVEPLLSPRVTPTISKDYEI